MSDQHDQPYFPSVPQPSLDIELRLRAVAQELPEDTRCALYDVFSRAHQHFRASSFELGPERLLVSQGGMQIAFPRPLPGVVYLHVLCGYEQWLERKYTLPGFVSVEPGDLVIDCGGYVGGFSLFAARQARQVHVFEPESANFACLRRNLARVPNAVPQNVGLFARTQTMTLNVSASGVEHSLLMPDDGEPVERRSIPVVSLHDYCAASGIERIDFLKLEAEGVELEIFDGLGDLRPRKLAIDVSPEREGMSPAADFRLILVPLGYEIRQRGDVMFARLP